MSRPGRRLVFRVSATLLMVLLAGASAAAFAGGQVFLAVVGASAAVLTAWAVVAGRGEG